MTEIFKIGCRVSHYKYGIGIIERHVSSGLAEVRFNKALHYVEEKNLKLIEPPEEDIINSVKKIEQYATRSQILSLLEIFDYAKAENIYKSKCISWWPIDDYRNLVSKAKEKQINEAKEILVKEIQYLLESGELVKANELYNKKCKDWWPESDFLKQKEISLYVKNISEVYKYGSLSNLDFTFSSRPSDINLSASEFIELKAPKTALKLESIDVILDIEQLRANCRPESRFLIKARAGSGKTKTLCARAALAILDENLNPNQVLILAFNKPAAAEARKRVQKMTGEINYKNARTFHSLAYQLVKSKKGLLFDEGGDPSEKEQSRFVQRLLHKILNPAFKESMLEFFRKELIQIESIGRDLPESEYLIFRRAMELVSLNGERVKSNGEKFIADFLFEHGIEYRYEKAWDWKCDFLNGTVYKPDFSIIFNGCDYIIEHWGINLDDVNSEVPDHWTTKTEDYRHQINKKRIFWKEKNIKLIETHLGHLKHGRDSFEKNLRDILERNGIQCKKLSQDEILNKVFTKDFTISKMAGLFLQFIQRAKKKGWSSEDASRVISSLKNIEDRNKIFYELALRTFREYENTLKNSNSMDYDDLVQQAADEINKNKGSASIHLGDGKFINISQIKWILIDEFQDFSELYFRMLEAILKVNPEIRLVAVGDDWQAINSFSGADLRFFEQFQSYFPESICTAITTNYRSDKSIVSSGNELMNGSGEPAKCNSKNPGTVNIHLIDDIWIEFRTEEKFQDSKSQDAIFLEEKSGNKNLSDAELKKAKALKKCASIITDNIHMETMILSRTKRVYGTDLQDFRRQLINVLEKLSGEPKSRIEHKISAYTSHGSKGQEADRVIILDATLKQFPKIHPDNLLFECFGVTPEKVLDEERRLFYVSLTRAKNALHIISEKGLESPYLNIFYGGIGSDISSDTNKLITLGETAQRIKKAIDQHQFENENQKINKIDPWQYVESNVSERFKNIVSKIRKLNIPIPEHDYYISNDEQIIDAELAWPNNTPPIAILTLEQEKYSATWTSMGWKVASHNLSDEKIIFGIQHYLGKK